jgi:hypothetical protein
MSFDLQIREQISRYRAGQIDVDALETWLSAIAWDIDQEPPATRQLAFKALRFVSEAANGDWTEDEIRENLGALAHTVLPDTGGSYVAEQFLGRLSAAEKKAQQGAEDGDARVAILMAYVRFATPTVAWFGSGQPSDRGFLHQPRGESDTQPPAPAELAIS